MHLGVALNEAVSVIALLFHCFRSLFLFHHCLPLCESKHAMHAFCLYYITLADGYQYHTMRACNCFACSYPILHRHQNSSTTSIGLLLYNVTMHGTHRVPFLPGRPHIRVIGSLHAACFSSLTLYSMHPRQLTTNRSVHARLISPAPQAYTAP